MAVKCGMKKRLHTYAGSKLWPAEQLDGATSRAAMQHKVTLNARLSRQNVGQVTVNLWLLL